ncbi:MAG: O-antigen ligase family protein [Brevinema sp.]
MNKSATLIGVSYGASLLLLALAIFFQPQQTRYDFFLGAGIVALLLIIFSGLVVFRMLASMPLSDKIFVYGCTLLVLLLPMGDLFIFVGIPLLVFYLIRYFKEWKQIFSFSYPPSTLWKILLAICFITSFFAQSIPSALAMTLALVGYGAIFALGYSLRLSEANKQFLSDLFTIVIATTVVFMIFHLKVEKPISLLGITFTADRSSASLISNWSANAAGFLAVCFVLLFVRFLRVLKEGINLNLGISTLALIIVFIGVWATQTRMVAFFFMGFGIVFLIFYPWNFLRRLRWILPLFFILLLPLLAHYSPKWRTTLQAPFQEYSFIDRANQISFGWDLLKDGRLMQGVGLFNFRHLYKEDAIAKDLPIVEFLHSMVFSMFVETGILGGLVFCLAIMVLFLSYMRSRSDRLAYAGMLLLSGIFFLNATDNWLFVLKFSALSFFLLGAFYPKKGLSNEKN